MIVIAELERDRPRGLHRRDRLRQPAGRARAQRRDPHVRAGGRPSVARRRRRHRRRLGSRRPSSRRRSSRRARSPRRSARRSISGVTATFRPAGRAARFRRAPRPGRRDLRDDAVQRRSAPLRDAHCARLNASARELYGVDLAALAAGIRAGRTERQRPPARSSSCRDEHPRSIADRAGPIPSTRASRRSCCRAAWARTSGLDRRLLDAITAAAGARAPAAARR